jgi:predicted MFS family arabinose efflux permease
MSNPEISGGHGDPSIESSAIYAAVMAVAVLNILPALGGVLALGLGWDAQTVGRFAACDSMGALVGTLLAAALIRVWTLRTLILTGLWVLATADMLSGTSSSVPVLLVSRLVGSAGGGLAIGTSFAIFASMRTTRDVALWSIGQLVFGFVAITALPRMTAAFGWQSAFFLLAALVLLGVVRVHFLPRGQARLAERSAHQSENPTGIYMWIAILGVALFYFGQGELWPYLEIMGISSGIDQRSVETSLSLSAVSALLGSLLVFGLGKRVGLKLPVILSFGVTIAAISSIHSADSTTFRIARAAFTFAWPIFSAYQFALIAASNPSGRIAALVTTANWTGLVAGPLVSGELLRRGTSGAVQGLSMALDTAAMLSLIPLVYWRSQGRPRVVGP